MGRLRVWDGQGLPEVGDVVLVHLASQQTQVPMRVTGFDVKPGDHPGQFYVDVDLECGNQKNRRSLAEIEPVVVPSAMAWVKVAQ